MSSVTVDWGVVGKLLGDALAIGAIIVGAFMTVLRPFFDTLIYESLGRNREKLRSLINEIYVKEFAVRDQAALNAKAALDISQAHTESLGALQTSIERQGEELRDLPKIATTLEKAFTTMTETLGQMQKEIGLQGRELGKISGYLEGLAGKPWDGIERRG